MTFAVDTSSGECNLLVQSLNVGNNMIFGGMFFTEFYYESYHVRALLQQPIESTNNLIYVGRNSIYGAYIGREVLTEGVNPFVPPTPPSDSTSLLWLWILLGCLLLAAIGGGVFCMYKKRGEKPNNVQAKYDTLVDD